MKIENFKTLISSLPVKQQCFTTKRSTWKKAENEFEWLKILNDRLFGNAAILTISRKDIFESIELRDLIIKTLYWGYPAGGRGKNLINIIDNIDIIEGALYSLKQKLEPTTADFDEFALATNSAVGLGLSTYSKLLYFLKLSFNGNPCLILDRRLIDVFNNNVFSNFHQFINIRNGNAAKKYLDFLGFTEQLAHEIGTEGENIELFLFTFGKNLKATL